MFKQTLDTAFRHSLEHLESLDRTPVNATADARTLRARLRKPLSNSGVDPEQVVAELARDVEGGLLGTAGGRFYAWVIGGALPAALGADWLTSAWDQNGGLYATSPAAAIVEEVAGEWLKDVLGIPASASFALVTGCQMTYATCLAAARHALLARRGWNVEEQGLYGAPPIRILINAAQHGSYTRSVRLLGLGLQQVVKVPVDSNERLRCDALERELEVNPSAPTIVMLQAGEINTGAFDPFEEAIRIAHARGAWVHVEGAFGLWAAASPKYRHLMRGAEAADSWSTDGHKWLNVPYDSGYAFVADTEAHRASMAYHASYLTHSTDARDAMDWTPEWSRRSRAFATYAALRQLGCGGLAELIDRCCEHAHAIVTGIGKLPGAEMLSEPIINQGLVRFLDSKPGATDADHDRRTDEVIAAINATGEAFFSGSTWRGKRAMRVSVCNWQTSARDVERTAAAVGQVLAQTPVGIST